MKQSEAVKAAADMRAAVELDVQHVETAWTLICERTATGGGWLIGGGWWAAAKFADDSALIALKRKPKARVEFGARRKAFSTRREMGRAFGLPLENPDGALWREETLGFLARAKAAAAD